MKKKTVILLGAAALVIIMLAVWFLNSRGKTKTAVEQVTKELQVTGEVKEDSKTGLQGVTFTEAPSLQEKVKAGKLPKVAERLPKASDIMVERMDSIGTYGAAFNFTYKGKSNSKWWYGKFGEEPLFRFKADGTIAPNVAKGYEVNDDYTKYTIHLREGIKWSDGVPFTAEDCVFFYDHMCVPETFGKTLYDCFKVNHPETGKTITCKFAKVADYTFTVTFQFPKPTFLEEVAINGKWCFKPAHYYKTILPEFIGEKAAAKKAKEMGFSDVKAMGKETGYYYWNVPGIPTLRPWIVEANGKHNNCDGELFIMKRNPYYWKVDERGQQLPYMDELRYTKVTDDSQTLLKVMEGSVDLAEIPSYESYDVLLENKKKGGYDLLEWSTTLWASINSQLQLNQTVQNPKLRRLFQNKDFRQALSIAVNREEFAELVSDGYSDPAQAAPGKGAPGYDPQWSRKWTKYDPKKAKTLLEGCGLKMGADGYYNFSDGTDFVLNLQTFTESKSDKSGELLIKYFKEVGIKTTYKAYDRSLFDNKVASNESEAIIGPVAPAETLNITIRPDTLAPIRSYAAWYGEVGRWYESDGEEGIEPTGDLKALCDALDELRDAKTKEARDAAGQKMLDLHKKNIWIIGYMSDTPQLVSKKTSLQNFPEHAIYCDEFRGLGLGHLQCCYLKK
jgi:peptide/nickel transport system substrate-binding protein